MRRIWEETPCHFILLHWMHNVPPLVHGFEHLSLNNGPLLKGCVASYSEGRRDWLTLRLTAQLCFLPNFSNKCFLRWSGSLARGWFANSTYLDSICSLHKTVRLIATIISTSMIGLFPVILLSDRTHSIFVLPHSGRTKKGISFKIKKWKYTSGWGILPRYMSKNF